MLLCSQKRRFRLTQVCHGFNKHHVATSRRNSLHLLSEHVVCFLKRHSPHRLKQRTRRADIARNIRSPRSASTRSSRRIHLGHRRHALKLQLVSAECVRGDNLGTRFHVRRMNGRNVIRVRKIQQLRQRTRIRQAALLQLRAHCAVNHQVVFAQKRSTQMLVFHAHAR